MGAPDSKPSGAPVRHGSSGSHLINAGHESLGQDPRLALAGGLLGEGVGEPVGVRTSFDDGAVEGQPVHDRGAQARVGEGFGPAGEGFVACDRDGIFLLTLGEDLEEELSTAAVQFHIAKLVNLCGHPHRSTYAEPATMPRPPTLSMNAGRWRLVNSKK